MKRWLRTVCLAGGFFAVGLILKLFLGKIPYGVWVSFAFLLAAYLMVGGRVLLRAGKNILRGQVFDENFLMAVSTVGAFLIGESAEAVAVMLFYQIGELFEHYAVGKSRKSITALMNIRPDRATLLREDGTTVVVDPSEVKVGDTVVVAPGEKIPLDGVILTGETSLDTAALTGESMPREGAVGDVVLSGCVNLTGLIHLRVTKEYGESTAAKILELVENATAKKAKSERFITRFAAVYTPIVVLLAVVLAVVPPVFLGWSTFADWAYRALNFLIVSCPCALVISVPLSFFGGIGGASKGGILIKGSHYLEFLAKADIAVFDKTGTLTKGEFSVTEVQGGADLLPLTAAVEAHSNHPIGRAVCRAYGERYSEEPQRCTEGKEHPGYGIEGLVNGVRVVAGNGRLMKSIGLAPAEVGGTVVHTAADGGYLGYLVLKDTVKPDASDAIAGLKAMGVRKTVMLTGDTEETAQAVADEVGIDEVEAKLLPGDKVAAVERLLLEKKGTLLYVGDGINDAPVLALADVGIAMGGLGQDAAIEAADVVIMTDEPSKLCEAVAIARKTKGIVTQNIVFAIGVKMLVLLLSALGHAGLPAAVFADVGVSVLAILNAMRCSRVGKKRTDGKEITKKT